MPRKTAAASAALTAGNLHEVLSKLRGGLAREDVIEQATFFALKGGLAWTYNDEIAMSIDLPKEVPDIEGALSAEPVLRLLSRLPSDAALTIVQEGAEVIITAGAARAGFVLSTLKLPVDSIPEPKEEDWRPLPENFQEATSLAACAALVGPGPIALSCVSISSHGVIGSDNFQLTKVEWKGKAKMPSFLLPAAAVQSLKDFVPTQFALDEGWIHFVSSGALPLLMSCRRPDAEYPPKVESLFDMKGDEVDLPASLKEATGRADVFAEAEFETEREVILTYKAGQLTVGSSSSIGSFRERLEPSKKTKLTEFEVRLNPRILSHALSLGTKFVLGESAILLQGEGFQHLIALT